jgi:membrane protein
MYKFWKQLTKKYPLLAKWEVKALAFTLPGFEGVPVYDVYKFFVAEISSNSMSNRSKSIAFSFFMAIFPSLTFVFTLIPFLPYFRNLDTHIMVFLKSVLPNQETYNFVRTFLEPILRDLAKHKRGGLLTGSLLLVLFLMSNGVISMLHSFDKTNEHYKKRTGWQNRLLAVRITFLLMALFLFSIVLIVLGEEVIKLFSHALNIENKIVHTLLDVVRYTLIVLLFFFSLSLIYYYGPNTKKKYKFISVGATVATLLSVLISAFFSYYVNNISRLNVVFGSIGTIMLLMVWLNINAFVLLIGYEINASIFYNKSQRSRRLEMKEEKILN